MGSVKRAVTKLLIWVVVMPPRLMMALIWGVVNIFKSDKEIKTVARNLALNYYVLKSRYADRLADDDQALLVSAVMTTMEHLAYGAFAVDDLKRGLSCARRSRCRMGHLDVFHNGAHSEAERFLTVLKGDHLLVSFCVQVTALVYRAHGPYLRDEIVVSYAIGRKQRIERQVQDARGIVEKALENPSYLSAVEAHFDQFFTEAAFVELRTAIGIV